jgi:single-strand DNA-binding protein
MSHVRSLNRVVLVGRAGRDPEITHIPSLDRAVAKFSLATSEGYMDREKQWQEKTEWHNLVAWGPLAQKVERSVAKGAMVLVEGKLRTRKWQDKNGQDRRTTEIEVENLVVLDRADKGGGYSDDNRAAESRGAGNQGGFPSSESQAPPERDIDDFPYDGGEGDPF